MKANAAVSQAALSEMVQVAVQSGVLFYDISTQTKDEAIRFPHFECAKILPEVI